MGPRVGWAVAKRLVVGPDALHVRDWHILRRRKAEVARPLNWHGSPLRSHRSWTSSTKPGTADAVVSTGCHPTTRGSNSILSCGHASRAGLPRRAPSPARLAAHAPPGLAPPLVHLRSGSHPRSRDRE